MIMIKGFQKVLLISLILFCFEAALFSQINTRGVPFVRNYSPFDYKAKNDNWAIVQDNRGIMYFGNSSGVLEFDGVYWKNIAPDVALLTMVKDLDGRIYGAGINQAGYIDYHENGAAYFVSILDGITNDDSFFGNFYNIVLNQDTAYFFSNRGHLLKWSNNRLVHQSFDDKFLYSVEINGTVYVYGQRGLSCYNGVDCIEISGGNQFKDLGLRLLFKLNDDTLIAVSRLKGVFSFSEGELTTYPFVANDFLKENQVYRATYFSDSLLAFGTVEDGVLISDLKGRPVQHINRSGGLQSNDHCSIYADNRMNIWSGLEYGVSSIFNNSPFVQINEQWDLVSATVYNMLSIGEQFFAGTAQGVFYSNLLNNDMQIDKRFKLVEGTGGRKAWVLDLFGNDLISSSSNVGTFIIEGFKAKLISRQVAKELRFAACGVLLGPIEHGGLGVFKKQNGEWKFKKQFNEFPNLSRVTIDKEGNVWANDKDKRILKISFDESFEKLNRIEVFDSISGLSSFANASVFLFNEQIRIGTSSGTFKTEGSKVVSCDDFNRSLGSDFHVIEVKKDQKGNLWLLGLRAGVEIIGQVFFLEGNRFEVELHEEPLKRIADFIHFSFYPLDEDNVFFGSSEKIIHYNPTVKKVCNDEFPLHIRSVKSIHSGDSLVFAGSFVEDGKLVDDQPKKQVSEFQFKDNALRFSYAAAFYEGNEKTEYQYYLKGFEKGWSDWSRQTEKEYSYLKEGKYQFNVKAKNVFGVQSSVATYDFVIMAPWYRTKLAYLMYSLLIGVFLFLLVKISNRRMLKEKENLERIVADRTAKVVEQKEELLVQSEVLMLQNEKNMKQNKEITSSIQYASRIQMALLTSRKIVEELIPDHFIFYKPLNIVSGDFYWIKKIGDVVVIAIADCTGHGVPGAFMSMLGIAYLNEIVRKKEITAANQVLSEMRSQIKQSLGQDGTNPLSRDGMELALVVIHVNEKFLEYSGANIPLLLYRNEETGSSLIEYKPDPMPLGIHLYEKEFTNHIVELQQDDCIYMMSDGFTDQIQANSNQKYSKKRLRKVLLEMQGLEMEKQKGLLELELKNWAGDKKQVDDILLAGFKLSHFT